jgi:hypothetical protein
MTKLGKVALGAVIGAFTLGFAHAWLNLGFEPLATLGLRDSTQQKTQFRVGFLPVT